MNKEKIITTLWEHAKYAVNSLSRDLIYRTLGELNMAVCIGVIDWEDVREIDRLLVRDTLNNPTVMNKLR